MVVLVWAGGVRAEDLAPEAAGFAKRGTIFAELWNDGITNHGPAVQSFATGRWETGSYGEPAPAPGRTLADAVRRAGRTVKIFAPGTNRYALLLAGGDESIVVRVPMSDDRVPPYPARSCDRPVTAAFLSSPPAALSFVFWEDTDVAHLGRWSRYRGAVRQGAALMERVLADAGPAADVVALSVHGRSDAGDTRAGFTGHGRPNEGCERLWMAAVGPDFEAGREVRTRLRLIDATRLLAELWGVRL